MKGKKRVEGGKTYYAYTGLSTEYDRLFDAINDIAHQLGYSFGVSEHTIYDTLGRVEKIETTAIFYKEEAPPK